MSRGILSPPPAALTHEKLVEHLHYDRKTGIFVWRVCLSNSARVGKIAGYEHSGGRWMIGISGTYIYAHRLAWFYVTGSWPLHEIDHINGRPSDNRFVNLREATRSQNAKNLGKRRDNTSGMTGVTWDQCMLRWHARIMVDGTMLRLGYFIKKADAGRAYKAAAKQNFGEFARSRRRARSQNDTLGAAKLRLPVRAASPMEGC
jgi:hypothetical protein